MKLQEFCDLMETIAPKALALEYDHVGLLIGPDHNDIKKVLVALDLTVSVAKEAIEGGFDLVLTHHPVFWDPIRRVLPSEPELAAPYLLMRNGIGHFAAHTNFDACEGGVNDTLSELIGLCDIRPLPPENLGRIGTLSHPMSFADFASVCETKLNARGRFVGDFDRTVSAVAVIGGSGGGDIGFVHQAGCDAFVTGEMKHHQALTAAYYGLNCCVLGHYETEFPAMKSLISRLQNTNSDVKYFLTHTGSAPLRCL